LRNLLGRLRFLSAAFPTLPRRKPMLDFSAYELIIDARSPREYEEDHIPGAINLPVVNNDEYAEVGKLHRASPHHAYLIGVEYSLRNIANSLPGVTSRCQPRAKILVYCFRGGKRSRLWFDALDTIGYKVERLKGGWKAYRRWVNAELEARAAKFSYNVLCGPTGCGKTRLLQALREVGAQVLDLEELAKHRGSLIGAIPNVEQPSQKLFETLVLEALMKFDLAKAVWVEAESKKIGERQVPQALFDAMHGGTCFRVEASMVERVKLWREDYAHFEQDPEGLLDKLRHLTPLIGNEEFAAWRMFAGKGEMPQLFERIMRVHYDPAYARSMRRNYPQIDRGPALALTSLGRGALREVAERLASGAQN
jgi:tRNA 2-selenouridine synthase